MGRRTAILTLTMALGLLTPTAAFASLADEQTQGRQLAAQLQSGAATCKSLSVEDLDHIGEYVMGRALGSTSVHQSMNDRMTQMMGSQAESRMHQILGARYSGCSAAGASTPATSGSGYGTMMGPGMMGPGMMGGYSGNGGWGAMMGSSDYRWMTGGSWNHMTRHDWQRLQHQWLGTAPPPHRMSTLAIVAITLAAALLFAALALLGFRRRARGATAST